MNSIRPRSLPSYRRVRGLSLIELMIAMVLGLMVVGVAIGIFISNRQTYRATENLARVQENARTAFEMMARDVREAGGNPCVNNLPVANVLNSANWWANLTTWGNAVRGYAAAEAFTDTASGFGTGAGQRLNGTDAIQLISGDDTVATISAHNTAGAQFTLNTATSGFSTGDLLMACNSRQASIFQASAVSGNTVSHAAGGANCTSGLGLPMTCGSGSVFEFAAPNSVMVRLHSARWYIANNARGIPSLYQSRLVGNATQNQEIAEGVTNMQITYLMRGGASYQTAAQVTATANGWSNVIAARIQLTLQGQENANDSVTTRQLIHVASLRNRNA